MTNDTATSRGPVRLIGLVGGPLAAVALYALVSDTEIVKTVGDQTVTVAFGHAGRATLGLMAWMAIWWVTEAIDVAATALLPIALLPLITVGDHASAKAAITAAGAPYANRFIALFMGGFILALAMERWGLHRRIALMTLRLVGTGPTRMIAGFMVITAGLSMWVSNTATTVMMLPIALSVTRLLADKTPDDRASNFPLCLMLGIAYAASIGGIGTLIGSPPNLLFAGFVESHYGIDVSFVRWLMFGLPLVVIFLPIAWLLLTRVVYPIRMSRIEGGAALIRAELARLGPPKPGEWITFVVFVITALAWIFRPLLVKITIGDMRPLAGLTDAGIAMIAALVLFVIPVDLGRRVFAMNWEWAKRLPWGILILFGGGLSLAAAVGRHGVADLIGHQAEALGALPTVVVVVAVCAGVIFLTELTSNTATTATLLPILAGIAPALDIDPVMLLVPATLAASCAFMMPVATPPNAIVFGSGHVTIPQMCKAGLWLNFVGIVLVTGVTYVVAARVLSG